MFIWIKPNGRVDFVSMNYNLLKQLKVILKDLFDNDTEFKTYPNRNNIGYLKTNQISKFYDSIYYDGCICLKRKKEKFAQYN
jgi:hypothetical protein